MIGFDPLNLPKGTPVLVKTAWGWMDGAIYDYVPHLGQVRVRVEKIKRGKRYLWPPGARNVRPHKGICVVYVYPSINFIRPSDRRVEAK